MSFKDVASYSSVVLRVLYIMTGDVVKDTGGSDNSFRLSLHNYNYFLRTIHKNVQP